MPHRDGIFSSLIPIFLVGQFIIKSFSIVWCWTYFYVICKAFDLIYFFLVKVVLCLCGYSCVEVENFLYNLEINFDLNMIFKSVIHRF
jgi:hypothetical protein